MSVICSLFACTLQEVSLKVCAVSPNQPQSDNTPTAVNSYQTYLLVFRHQVCATKVIIVKSLTHAHPALDCMFPRKPEESRRHTGSARVF